ncbi:DnaJ C-terminal domain-containing protein [Bosea sp. RAC05]|uniref:DnaJ C-terminal domain-containing protein n=1 Tax=Bosea sp. RAC05 TaxID=1842539 RepID=UPI00083DD6E9|nr:DnaJ C-terminal domain-containing protein [Bosea sp. RAC05]AOG02967.1 dnaJ domain protein [Bosea sp. RAC05]
MTAEFDPFDLLGLPETADEAAVKAAYRRLAKDWHPDKGAKPEDVERFKALNAARQCLLDPQLRARALAQRAARRKPSFHEGFDQVFRDMEAASQRRDHRRAAPPPVRAEIEISLEQAYRGGVVSLGGHQASCTGCKGLGRVEVPVGVTCPSCRGHGMFQQSYGLTTARIACVDCSSTGKIQWCVCSTCQGYGAAHGKLGKIRVPAGIETGSIIKETGRVSGADLEVRVTIKPHQVFLRKQDDLVARIRIPVWDAALGCTRKLTAIDGTIVAVDFSPGTQSRSMRSYGGLGMPGADGRRGAMVVIADVVIPDASVGESQVLFSQMRARLGASAV